MLPAPAPALNEKKSLSLRMWITPEPARLMLLPLTVTVNGVALPALLPWSSARSGPPLLPATTKSSSLLLAVWYSPLLHCTVFW